jgi:putative transposase
MRLVEKHIIKKSHSLFKEIDNLCFLSKNIYNKANYIIRQEFIGTSKEKEAGLRENAIWIRYNKLQKQLQNDKDFDYKQLPAKISQHVLKTLDKNWTSFFASIRDYKKNPQNYEGCPGLPKYKHKTKGRNILTYTIQAISKPQLKNGIALLSGTTVAIQTNKKNIQQVRIIPRYAHYVIEVVYIKEIEQLNLDKNNIAGIDIGLNNLATITSNLNNVKPLLINGKPLKSINQYYNKKKAKLQSFVGDKSSNRLEKLTTKRNRKVDNYLHNASNKIVKHLISNNIGTLVIGKNKQWKTEINIGKRNNQHFVCIAHARFISMIEYKCVLIGITVKYTEESHTSKCSFIDFETIQHHEIYLGRRIKRGMFISKDKRKINADCNGSGNIIRKVFPNAFANGIQGVVVRPLRLTPYKLCS